MTWQHLNSLGVALPLRDSHGKSDLHPDEIKWMQKLEYVRVSFCKNLHAKCYINESTCIISSLNLYEFSQVNNNEMGILIEKDQDDSVFKDAYEEAQRIIRISDEVRISLDEVKEIGTVQNNNTQDDLNKLTTSKLAAKHKIKTNELLEQLVQKGFLILNDKGKHQLTEQGKNIGGEFKTNSYGGYFLWNSEMNL